MGNAFSSCVCCSKCESKKKSSKERVLPSDLHSCGGTVKRKSDRHNGNGNRPTNIKLNTGGGNNGAISNHDVAVHISNDCVNAGGDNNSFSFPLHGIQKSSPVTPTGLHSHGNKDVALMTSAVKREVDDQSVKEFFIKYNDANNGGSDCDVILADGIQRLCEDLQVSPTDFIVLVFAWQLNAATQCQFSIEEFTSGCKKLKVDSIASLLMAFPYMEETALEKDNFKELYRFTFQFTLENEQGQRTLPRDVAIAMWEIVFSKNTPAILQDWTEYLNNNNIRGISRDTWNMFLLLVDSLNPDYCNYDVTEAWPSLFDEFVEYKQKNRQPQEEVEDTSQPSSANNEKTVTSPLLRSNNSNPDDVTDDDDDDSVTSSSVSSTKDDVVTN